MSQTTYTASKSRTQGRPGWTVSFRHPLRNDTKGRPGLKMRRGLNTTDANEADRLVAEMNTILSDTSWWSVTKRAEAERTFSSTITAAFYDEIQAGRTDSWIERDNHITLPTEIEGYSRVLLVGTTGAGKTSLLRHLIGSDPDEDRFPSTSTAKTTISDIEIVQAEGRYSAVVTFFSEFWVQASVEECVADACDAVWEDASVAKIADRLLNHRDQRFRLGYTLGSWGEEQASVEEDAWSFEGTSETEVDGDDQCITDEERAANQAVLRAYVARIQELSKRVIGTVSNELGEDIFNLDGADRDAAQELFEERLQGDDEFGELVHDIMDEIRRRFDLLDGGNLTRHQSGWPSTWLFDTDDRAEFIKQIRWFSSNYERQFGRLLTPLVDGVRARGPFFPSFTKTMPKLVLLDGQGLGHTPESSASVTTSITRRFADVDVILLVDSAQQPMQAAPLSVVRAVAASGHQQKLAIAFTHFDLVKGVNLPTFAAKRAHVMASVTNGLTNLRDVLGVPVVKAIERKIDGQCFMLGGLDLASKRLPKGVVVEMEKMLGLFTRAIEPEPEPQAYPVYNPDGLVLALQAASRSFRRPWTARLGLGPHENVHKEHWARIKALNRRIAGELANEYLSLMPVADLVACLIEEVSKYLDQPTTWEPRLPANEEEAEAALSGIRQRVYTGVHALAERRLVNQHLDEWRSAYDLLGKGSTFDRAQEINSIYERGAPVASTVMTKFAADFVQEMRGLVHQAILEGGGRLEAQVVVPADTNSSKVVRFRGRP